MSGRTGGDGAAVAVSPIRPGVCQQEVIWGVRGDSEVLWVVPPSVSPPAPGDKPCSAQRRWDRDRIESSFPVGQGGSRWGQ